jgi:hypothetical protein
LVISLALTSSSPSPASRTILAGIDRVDGHGRREAGHRMPGAAGRDLDLVGAGGACDGDGVQVRVEPAEVDGDGLDGRAGEITHGHGVGAASRGRLDGLDARHIRRADTRRADFDELVGGGARNGEPVDTPVAGERVGAVGEPERGDVVAVTELDPVRAAVAARAVVAGPTAQGLGGRGTREVVRALVALEREPGHVADRGQLVVAAAGLNDHAVGVRVLDTHVGFEAGHADRVAEHGRADAIVSVGPGREHAVRRAVEEPEVGVDASELGRGQVPDVDEVLPTASEHLGGLDAHQVGEAAGVADDPRVVAERLQRELL